MVQRTHLSWQRLGKLPTDHCAARRLPGSISFQIRPPGIAPEAG
jgi:hypothetical protein